ncbi:MAG TPA: hypothetical protein VJS91_01080 [Nitrososphaeraceae archaeon]|nr:hypothetical protein [Nitrososphaeraceae archaeon]
MFNTNACIVELLRYYQVSLLGTLFVICSSIITVYPLLVYASDGNVTGSPEDEDESNNDNSPKNLDEFFNDGASANDGNTGGGNEGNNNDDLNGNFNDDVSNSDRNNVAADQFVAKKNTTRDILPQVSKLGMGEVTTITALDPSNLNAVEVLVNLTSNKIQLVASQFTAKGMEHAVIINLTKLSNLENGASMYRAGFGSSVNGINPFTGTSDNVNSINNLLLRNSDTNEIQFNGTIGKVIVTTNN